MVKNHLQRIAAPKAWKIERKKHKFIARPNPGAHTLKYGISLSTVLKEILEITKTTKEVKQLLNNKEIIVNGRTVHDVRYCVGLMDIISIPKIKVNYRVVLDTKGRLSFVAVEDMNLQVARVETKLNIKGNKQNLGLYGGISLLSDMKCSPGDSLLLDSRKPVKVLPLKEGSYVHLMGGRHIGKSGKLTKIYKESTKNMIHVEFGKETLTTLKHFAYVVGEGESEIKLE